jgi:hypothetical protein
MTLLLLEQQQSHDHELGARRQRGGYLAGGTVALLEILKSTAMLRRRCDGHMEGRLADAS